MRLLAELELMRYVGPALERIIFDPPQSPADVETEAARTVGFLVKLRFVRQPGWDTLEGP